MLNNLTKDPYFKYLKKKLYPTFIEKSYEKSFGEVSDDAYVSHYLLESKKNDNSPQTKEVLENEKNLENKGLPNGDQEEIQGNIEESDEPKPKPKSRKILNEIKQYITVKNIVFLAAFIIFVQQSLSYLKKR